MIEKIACTIGIIALQTIMILNFKESKNMMLLHIIYQLFLFILFQITIWIIL
jgi:hypothetical protein